MKFRSLFLVILFLITGTTQAQGISASLRKARAAVDKGDYEVGAIEYGKALKADSNHLDANLEYGLLLFEFLNNPSKGGYYIKKAEKQCKKDTAPEILFGLAKYYHHISRYEEAIRYYQRLMPHIDDKNPEGQALLKELARAVGNCRYAMEGEDMTRKRVKIKNAGAGVNTLYPEYVPVVTPDGQTMIFTSRRKISQASTINDEDGGFYEDMFMADKGPDGSFGNPQAFSLHSSKIPGQSDRHESVVSLSFVNNKLYTFFDGRLYESEKQGKKFTPPVLLGDTLSAKEEFRNHICLSEDGKVLYFSADRKGGLGGLDIYKSIRQADARWGPAENLGNQVNTPEDDNSPQLGVDGNTLYFASKGHIGYGGYDLFKTVFKDGAWSKAENLGRPFSGPADDIYLVMSNAAETKGYFSSSRPGGFGDMDIYEIGYEMPFEQFVKDSLDRISILIADTAFLGDTVSLSADAAKLGGEVGAYYWQINDSVLAQSGNPVKYRFTKPGVVFVRTHAELNDRDKTLVGAEKKIIVVERVVPVATATTGTTTAAAGVLESLEAVYFDLNKTEMSAEAQAALDRNIEVLKKNPDARIEIAGYSDVRGATGYNKALSARRAQAVAKYLRNHGISGKRISKTSGYGEEHIVNRCAEDVSCTEAEHGANRRVALKWTGPKK